MKSGARLQMVRVLLVTMLCGNAMAFGELGVTAEKTAGGGHKSLHFYPEAVVTASDPGSGIVVSVDPDGTGLTARDASGAVLWHADVLKQTGSPYSGFPVVRRVGIVHGTTVSIVVGKSRTVEAD